jgi:hypothetical protein
LVENLFLFLFFTQNRESEREENASPAFLKLFANSVVSDA